MDLRAIALQIGFGGIIACNLILALLFSAFKLTVSKYLKNLKAFWRHNELFVILHTFNFVIKKKPLWFVLPGCEIIHSAVKLLFQVFDLGRQLQLLVVSLLSLQGFLFLNARGFLR